MCLGVSREYQSRSKYPQTLTEEKTRRLSWHWPLARTSTRNSSRPQAGRLQTTAGSFRARFACPVRDSCSSLSCLPKIASLHLCGKFERAGTKCEHLGHKTSDRERASLAIASLACNSGQITKEMGGNGKRPGDGGAPGGGKRKKTPYFTAPSSAASIPTSGNIRGFIATCQQTWENKCVAELQNVLTEMLEPASPKLAGGDQKGAGGIAAELEKEIAQLRDKEQAPLTRIDSGCKGLVFLKLSKEQSHVVPEELILKLLKDILATRQSRTRFCQRILPVSATCYATVDDIAKAVQPLLHTHFPAAPAEGQGTSSAVDKEGAGASDKGIEGTEAAEGGSTPGYKFSVVIEVRNNSVLDKMAVINAVAKQVPAPHKVDLNNPDKVILVQVVKTSCCLGVATEYKALGKYNISLLLEDKKEGNKSKGSEEKKGDKGGDSKKAGADEEEGQEEEEDGSDKDDEDANGGEDE
eukprot:jgi/Mesvir1/15273/Mv06491-RA.1